MTTTTMMTGIHYDADAFAVPRPCRLRGRGGETANPSSKPFAQKRDCFVSMAGSPRVSARSSARFRSLARPSNCRRVPVETEQESPDRDFRPRRHRYNRSFSATSWHGRRRVEW